MIKDKKLAFVATMSPSSKKNLARLEEIKKSDQTLRLAVFGKYNHGKSTLLNALIGEEIFKAADKRETVEIKEVERDGIIWIDTPGLDADIAGEDDRKAKSAALLKADTLALVHNVRTGELDRKEMDIYRRLMKQCCNYGSKIIVVLTQIDQIDEENLVRVKETINKQLPGVKIITVSSTRYIKGRNENKALLVDKSNMQELKGYIKEIKENISVQRKKEMEDLIRKSTAELLELYKNEIGEIDKISNQIKKMRKKLAGRVKEIQKVLGYYALSHLRSKKYKFIFNKI